MTRMNGKEKKKEEDGQAPFLVPTASDSLGFVFRASEDKHDDDY